MTQDTFRYHKVEQHVLDLAESGVLKNGDKLPSLRRLSKQLHVSVSTVSQAYMELEKKGLIEARERSGFYLSDSSQRLPQPVSRPRPRMTPTFSSRSRLIHTVLDSLGNPDLLPYGVVCPAAEVMPAKIMARLLNNVMRQNPEHALNYSPVGGDPELRRQIAMRGVTAGMALNPEEILITNGAMEGISIALRALTHPGENVLIQSPSYFCFLQLLENCGLRAIEIPSSSTGIDPEDVRKAVERFDIKATILVPNFNNPDGSLTSDEVKREIVEILAERNIPLIEDDVCGDLSFADQRPSTCKAFDQQGTVILSSSFSKTIAPGYRVGWIAPGRYFDKMQEIKTTTNISTAAPNQLAIAAFLAEGHYERHLRRLRNTLHKQMETMLPALRRYFPEQTKAHMPEGGAAIWVELPEAIDAIDYFYQARESGIGIAPGPIFSTQDKYNNFIRLNCNGVWNEAMHNGLQNLGELACRLS